MTKKDMLKVAENDNNISIDVLRLLESSGDRGYKKSITEKLKDTLHTICKKEGYVGNISVLYKLDEKDADKKWLNSVEAACKVINKSKIKTKVMKHVGD